MVLEGDVGSGQSSAPLQSLHLLHHQLHPGRHADVPGLGQRSGSVGGEGVPGVRAGLHRSSAAVSAQLCTDRRSSLLLQEKAAPPTRHV